MDRLRNNPFRIFVFTAPAHDDPALAVAAGRAGAVGIFDAEFHTDAARVTAALAQLARHARAPYGLNLGRRVLHGCGAEQVAEFTKRGLKWLVISQDSPLADEAIWREFQQAGGKVLAEIQNWDDTCIARFSWTDAYLAKGQEAGGWVGEETSFILLQRLLAAQGKPVYVRGGIGPHSVAACYAAGAAGAVLDSQVLLLRESPLRERLSTLLKDLVGTETVALGDAGTGSCFRVLERPGFARVRELRARAALVGSSDWRAELESACGWDDTRSQLLPMGQDVAFAEPLARRYVTMAGVLHALREGLSSHLDAVTRHVPLAAGAALAVAHGTRYPIVQGPMTRVSDSGAFAQAVAEAGGLPMVALALMRGEAVRALLSDTAQRLRGQPWGVGLLGFASAELLAEQIRISKEFSPAFAIIAGGRPDQALGLEKAGVPSYLHVPSPRLLSLFVEQGARRFVFEGRECGGHIGPLSSFVLWDSMVETLLAEVKDERTAQELCVLFAGGIHDERSAAMVAALAAPLASRGIRVGILMGTAYLFTREILDSGAIVPGFQQEALACRRTVSLETGTGHATRCVDTPFARQFLELKNQAVTAGKSADEIREELEALNLGRLRLASKGMDRSGPRDELQAADAERQHREGMYMIGQVAALKHTVLSVGELHHAVTDRAMEFLLERARQLAAMAPAARAEVPADVAIIGVGCVLPKAHDAREYWENILDRVDGITEIPPHRWDWRTYFDADPKAPDKIYSKWGGFLDDMVFDPLRYGMPPKAIKAVDPLQLMTLEVVRQALQDAGYAERPFNRERVSVIFGASGGAGDVGSQYAVRAETPRFAADRRRAAREQMPRRRRDAQMAELLPKWTEDSFAGILLNVAAGRAANRYDFGGLNFTVDAACASSLTAIYLATMELQAGRSDMAIAGGVDTVQGPFGYLCFSKTQALSPRGRCSTFDAGADGIVISEGIAVVALKRLADAERDGDRIYAVIKGVGGSSDGRAKSLTAPYPAGQLRALHRAYDMAGYSPATVELFEAHGTGTVAGDTAELETVTRLLTTAGAAPKQSAIGSVKTLIGHTKATAGVAGLIKSALALYHRTLPPHANVTTPNSKIADPASPLYLVSEAQPWVANPAHPRRAAVSAFGFGGTNFHIALEEYRDEFAACPRLAVRERWPAELLVWRGADRGALAAALHRTCEWLKDRADIELRDLAYTLARQARAGDSWATLIIGRSESLSRRLGELLAHLEDPAKPLPPGAYFSATPLARSGKVAGLFAGQGSQYPHMLRELAFTFEGFRAVLAHADRILAEPLAQWSVPRLSQLIYPGALYTPADESAAQRALTRTEIAQPALGAVEAGLWQVMQDFGLRIDMAGGHSYGEYAALYAAGALDLDGFLRVSEARGRFIAQGAQGQGLGSMLAVRAERAVVERHLKGRDGAWIANHNSPEQVVVSGAVPALEALAGALTREGIEARLLDTVGAAFHSPFVAPARDRLAEIIATLELRTPAFPVYSNTTAQPHAADVEVLRGTLAQHLVQPVEFVAEVEAMYAAGARVFIGLGPKAVQVSLVDQILKGRPHRVIRIDDREGGLKGLLHGMGALLAEGVPLQLEALFAGRDCRMLNGRGVTEPARTVAPPSHAWLLNGSGARPITQPPPAPLALEAVQVTHGSPASAPAAVAPSHSSVQGGSKMIEHSSPPASGDPAIPAGEAEGARRHGDDRAGFFASYQETMRQFLQSQEHVMVALLNGAAGTTQPARTMPRVATRPAVQPVPRVAGPVPAPAPGVSATRAAPATKGNGKATSIEVAPAATPAPALKAATLTPAPAPALDARGIADLLLGVVEDRTGYPRDMLALDQNMEAELGIDSIKRAEIVGVLLKTLPQKFNGHMGEAAASLNGKKTLQGMIDWLASQAGAAQEAAPRPFEGAGAGRDRANSARLPRLTIAARSESAAEIAREALPGGLYLLSADAAGIADALARHLEREGCAARVLDASVALDVPRCSARLAQWRAELGPVRGLIHLAPLGDPGLDGAAGLEAWRSQTERGDKLLHRLLRELAADLRERGRVLAASRLGGSFGREAAPSGLRAQGGAVGLLKSLREEWPTARVKAVDLDPSLEAEAAARCLLDELKLPGGRIEVGYPGGNRTVFVTGEADLDPRSAPLRTPDADWVVLATGGARGITAETLRDFAACGSRLILVGRSPEPAPEPSELGALHTAEALRHALVEQGRARPQAPRPADIERQVQSILQARELRANLESLRGAGAAVEYRAVEMRDAAQVEALLEDIYQRHGRLDVVLHGAGIIADKLLVDKTPDSFARVYDTKVDSAFLLARCLRPETLRCLVLFASVAGRYGNSGQTDYAAANEVLNRVAWQLHARWGDRVKVVAMNWGPWAPLQDGAGMVSEHTRSKFESKGVELVKAEQGRALLWQEITQGRAADVEVIAGAGPWETHEAEIGRFDAPPVNISAAVVQPLLVGVQRRTGPRGEEILRRTISLAHDLYLGQHLLDEIPVLPAAVALELMAEAAALVWPAWTVTELSELRVLNGIRLEQPTLDVEVVALASSHGDASGFAATLALRLAGGDGRPFYKATAHLANSRPESTAYQSMLQPGPAATTAQHAYRERLFHGPCLQTIERLIGLDRRGALAEVRPTQPGEWLPGIAPGAAWLFDPGLVDSGPQMAILWAHATRGETALPSRMGRVRRFGAQPLATCRMHFLLYPEQSPDQVKADVAFVDGAGQLRLFIEELECTSSANLNRLGGGWKGEIRV
jgi:acyl transferase domain-containing protein/NAD(P)H-dependent flavin oxidoreductase YrpB (nitropropane dioxygenase family)/NADP-dependent 3-hydroxy acid dehydrogenase YdfG